MQFGWPINFTGQKYNTNVVNNHSGAMDFPAQIQDYLVSEITKGRILGPFHQNPLCQDLAFSPLNSVEKQGSLERRIIMDLSFPPGLSVNEGILKEIYQGEQVNLRYPSVDDLVDLVKKKGQSCLLFKVDLKSAWEIHLLSYVWNSHIYIDLVMAMGCCSAALCCQRFTNSLAYIYGNMGFHAVNYLDDFGCAEVPEKAHQAYDALKSMLSGLGVQVSQNKCCSPSTYMVFWGVQFDTVSLTLSITNDRLSALKSELMMWKSRTNTTLKQVQSLSGKLNFIGKCIPSSRIFVARLLNFIRIMSPKGKYPLDAEFQKDIDWWTRYLDTFNGTASMIPASPKGCVNQVFFNYD
jgi:hypothetical protein